MKNMTVTTAKILIADDESTTRLILTRFVEKLGFEAVCASNGDEALALAYQHNIDLALLDADMPVKDGFECSKALYKQHGNMLPILMVTALNDEASIDKAFSSGAIDFITKPINWAVLRNRVQHLLQVRRDRQALKLAEDRKSALIDNAIDCIISITPRGRVLDFNPAAEIFFGYSKAEAMAKLTIEKLLPHYTQLVYRTLIDKHLSEEKKSYRHETIAIDKEGHQYTVELALSQIEFNGKVITTAMLHDISQRKQQEDELKLASTVFNFCNEGIMISNKDNIIEAVNPSFSRITGYSSEEVVGKNPSILNSSKHDSDFYQDMWQTISEKGIWQGEIVNKRKDGNLYNEWLSIRTVSERQTTPPNHYVAIFSDVTKRKEAERKIWWQAHYDGLTNLPNRSMFMNQLNSIITNGKSLSLFFIDLDGFKAVNDNLGHACGDDVLLQVAQRLQHNLPEESLVARLGGDEFTVILNGDHDSDTLLFQGNTLVSILSQAYQCGSNDQTAQISASIGIARYPTDAKNIDDLINLADKMMYQVKNNGKSGVLLPELSQPTL